MKSLGLHVRATPPADLPSAGRLMGANEVSARPLLSQI